MLSFEEFRNGISKWFGISLLIEDGSESQSNINTEDKEFFGYDYGKRIEGTYKKSQKNEFKNFVLVKELSGEIMVKNNLYFWDNADIKEMTNDDVNKIRYEISRPSLEYTLHVVERLIKMLEEKVKMNTNKKEEMRIKENYKRNIKINIGEKNKPDGIKTDIEDVLKLLLKNDTLKISYEEKRNFESLSNSFAFHLMVNSNRSLVFEKEFERLIPSVNMRVLRRSKIQTPPLRIYDITAVDHYTLALDSKDTYIKYLSFYHVLECFYEKVFKNGIINDLRMKLTDPKFHYKNDNEIYDIVDIVSNKINSKTGHGTERESLKYVIKEYIDLKKLKNRIDELDSKALLKYEKSGVEFSSKVKAIDFSDKNEKNLIQSIADRIYDIRNSLVHSSANGSGYKAYEHKNELIKEIALVRGVAEGLIINSGKVL